MWFVPAEEGTYGRVYFGCEDGYLYVLGPDGAERWTRTLEYYRKPPSVNVVRAGDVNGQTWGSYVKASQRVDAALGVNRAEEALTLRRQITAALRPKAPAPDPAAVLHELDEMIAQNRLGAAVRQIEALLEGTKDAGLRSQLDARGARIQALVANAYRRAIAHYRQEEYKQCAELLRLVVDVDPDYEQAADYLEKASFRQALLESF